MPVWIILELQPGGYGRVADLQSLSLDGLGFLWRWRRIRVERKNNTNLRSHMDSVLMESWLFTFISQRLFDEGSVISDEGSRNFKVI